MLNNRLRRRPNIKTNMVVSIFSIVCKVVNRYHIKNYYDRRTSSNPANTSHWPDAGLMLAQRLRLWSNINPALGEWLVFVEKSQKPDNTSYSRGCLLTTSAVRMYNNTILTMECHNPYTARRDYCRL